MKMYFNNLVGTAPFSLTMEHKGEKVNLIMAPLISRESKKRSVGGIASIRQFEPILVYMANKGIEDKVFKIYSEVSNRIMSNVGSDDNGSSIVSIIEDLLELVDFKEMTEFVVKTLGREAPPSLPDNFDNSIAATGFGKEKQTYLKHEYVELCAFITILKLILPPLIHHQHLTATGNKDKRAYDGIMFISELPIMNVPPVAKLKGLIEVLRGNSVNNDIQVTLNNIIATSDVTELVFSVLVINKLFTTSFLEDTDTRHIIKVLHGKAEKMLSPGGTSSFITIGKESNVDNSNENSLSVLENIKVGSKLSLGDIEEFNYIFTNMDRVEDIHGQLGIEFDEAMWSEIYNNLEVIEHVGPTDLSLEIVGWVIYSYGGILNPESIDYLRAPSLRSLITIVTIFFIKKNMLNIAMMVSSIKHYGFTNTNSSKTTIGIDKLDKLDDIVYGEDLAKININNISKEAMVFMYSQTIPDRYIIGNERIVSLSRSIRLELADLAIFLLKE